MKDFDFAKFMTYEEMFNEINEFLEKNSKLVKIRSSKAGFTRYVKRRKTEEEIIRSSMNFTKGNFISVDVDIFSYSKEIKGYEKVSTGTLCYEEKQGIGVLRYFSSVE